MGETRWPGFLVVLAAIITIIITVTTTHLLGGNLGPGKARPRKGSFLPTSHLNGGSSDLRAQVRTSPVSGGL